VLGLTAHLKRLQNADASLLRRSLTQLLEPYRPGEARVRVMQTKSGEIHIAIEPLRSLPREVYENGVRVETTGIRRISPREKSTAFISQSDEERKKIAKMGIFEALLVKNGRILEGMTSNFFYVVPRAPESAWGLRERSEVQLKGGILCTAQRDILLGVTRRTVIRVARGRGVEVRYSPLKLDQLSAVGEAFITSSSRGVVPVVKIDDVTVGEGRVGEVTRQLSAAYEAYLLCKAEKI
jgi:branched-chain amino acid aminotransferase